ncbi:MAG: hypothetical protein SH850_08055 [Planctomycetaceae bacterium]|nr:hypothetical protein [Planctomycetaceae bacterium]
MAAAHCSSDRGSVSRSPSRSRRPVREGLIPRTIFFPAGVLRRIEQGKPPGELIAVLTVLLSDWMAKGGAA